MKIPFLIFCLSVFNVEGSWNIEEISKLARRFAPIIWFHEEEEFFPSSIDFHFAECDLRDGETIVSSKVTAETLPTGTNSSHLHLNTKEELDDPQKSDLEFFKGQDLDLVPVYAFVRPVSSDPLEMEIKYSLFFPYNRGKLTCVGLWHYETKTCRGKYNSFGHHVSDWEGVNIYIKDNAVNDVYLGTHHFGAYYRWNKAAKIYEFYYGEEQDPEIDFIYPEYPKTLEVEGERAVTYAANGSHGMWSQPGKNYYSRILQLYDNTGRGYTFETQDKLHIYIWDDESFPPEWSWLGYEGRWGNEKMGCLLEPLTGECELNNGSKTPNVPNSFLVIKKIAKG